MSDPVTKGEIEDVLSSIRRLVAADSARAGTLPKETPKPERAEEPSEEDAPERLVLTPSFRVAEDERPQTDPSEDATEEDDDALPPEMLRLTRSLAARDRQAAEAEAEEAQEAAPGAEGTAAEEAPDFATRRTSIERTIAELEAAVTGQAEDWEPDGSEVRERKTPDWDFSALGADTFELKAGRRAGRPQAGSENAEEVSGESEEATSEEVASEEEEALLKEVSSGMAAIWAEARESEDAAERDEAEALRQPTFGEREALYAADEEEALDVVQDDPGDAPEAPVAGGEETEFLDEEALRELVSEIVRQELQGALGERITRNVRKLVRREIYRILQSQEFE